MVEIIGVPFDLGGLRRGSALGPAAVRYAGIVDELERLDISVRDRGDLPAVEAETTSGGLRNFPPFLQVVRRLRTEVESCLAHGNLPLVLGGDHGVVIGGISAALAKYGDRLALLWIDAHTDVNTPNTSESGNLHGMPVAALAGLESGCDGVIDEEWEQLLGVLGPERLALDNTAWYAIRDVDFAERSRLKGLALTMHHIDREGLVKSVVRLDEWLRAIGAEYLWISFDVDALDPILAPGTGTAVRGGLSYREAHLCAELLHERFAAEDCPYRLAGVDVVETNPLVDANNATAVMAVEWVASLLGKTILGKG